MFRFLSFVDLCIGLAASETEQVKPDRNSNNHFERDHGGLNGRL